ncbi:hypothetical protein P389DRAFT_174580 [Cystobasidium minutum MCA 4210]|uniref:uncharacterized protein n=1 Tax=Cystobasidium minutum MCA 4210 TaxID=1397322 RepID=UPI0034CED6F4|eukprot:jgi/Rhomi1/174580/fgenesh1_kg.8_\
MGNDDEPERALDATTSTLSQSTSISQAQTTASTPASLPASTMGDPEDAVTTTPSNAPATTITSKKNKKWPAYFFPSLATQRMSFCLDVLKREDIKSVCEFGCGQGAVLRPMTNGASHIDSFPEAMFDEASLMAAEEDEDEEAEEAEDETEDADGNKSGDIDTPSISAASTDTTSNDEDEDSIAPSQSASRRQSVQLEDEQVADLLNNATAADSTSTTADDNARGRSPPPAISRGRQQGPSISPSTAIFNPARRSSRSLTPEPIASSSNIASKLAINHEILEKYKKLPGPRKQDKELHLRRIAGLDLTEDVLLEAIEVTAPPPEEPSPFLSYFTYSNRDRWEDLRVELWQGSLDVYNDALDNFEAFIMTEVIEHLYPKQLDKFPEILFGSYRPRIIVITTPNYDFNQYFSKAKQQPPSSSSSALVTSDTAKDAKEERMPSGEKLTEDETKNSFEDPTGRTDRYFRDEDHKFEWTEAEFKEWCEGITSKFDYTVEYSGVGSLKNYLGKSGMYAVSDVSSASGEGSIPAPPPHIKEILDSVPDPSKVFATQTAVFRRKYAYESERSPRSPIQMPLAFYGVKPSSSIKRSPLGPAAGVNPAASLTARKSAKQRSNANDTASDSSTSRSPDKRHKLLKAHYYKAHPLAGNPKSSKAIRAILDDLMRERMRLRSVSLRELWGRNEVAQACGGYMNKLIQALIKDPKCAWDIDFDYAVLEKGGEMEDAVRVVLKDFVEPEKPNLDSLEGLEDDDDADEKDQYIKNGDDDTDGEDDAETSASNTQEGEGQVISAPAKLSKKQRKLKRMEEAPFLAPIFPIENEQIWMPQKGSEDAKGWEEWTNPARASTMITEDEWAKESGSNTASGWD